jgi:TRAP-type mannitol/chloroaromatic compound transport system permease small subunit
MMASIMKRLLTIANALERLSTMIGRLAAWLLLALVLVIVADVTLRHWFVIGSTKLQELEWHLHGALFLLSLGWAYSANSHVRIELISDKWSPKRRAAMELIGCLLFLLPYVAAVLWFSIDYVGYSLTYDEASASPTGLPNRWLIKSMIPVGFSTLAMAAASKLLKAIIFIYGPQHLHDQTGFNKPREEHAPTLDVTKAQTLEGPVL